MSTLQVSTAQITTLSDGTNSTSCTNAIQGSAKAWVNFDGNGSAGTIPSRASYNVSTVTKNSTGDYTINFTNSLVDANYAVSANASELTGNIVLPFATTRTQLSNSVKIQTNGSSSIYSPTDRSFVSVVVFR